MRAQQVLRRRRIGYSALSVIVVAAVGLGALQFTNVDANGRPTDAVGTPNDGTYDGPKTRPPPAVFHVRPETPTADDAIVVALENVASYDLGYGIDDSPLVERRVSDGWEKIGGGPGMYDALTTLAPARTTEWWPIGSLPAGTYRVSQELSPGDFLIQKTFTVAPSTEPTAGPAIAVTTPLEGDRVRSPIVVSGTADVYEATVSIRVKDSHGKVIAETFTTATCGSGCRGRYLERVEYEVDEDQGGTVEVYSVSAENGEPMHMVKIPVVLLR